MPTSDSEEGAKNITFQAMGRVENAFDEPAAPDLIQTATSQLILEPQLVAGLKGIEPEQRLLVIFYFHRSRGYELQQHLRGDLSRARRGIFALRSPRRPNPIGVTVVVVLAIEGNTGPRPRVVP